MSLHPDSDSGPATASAAATASATTSASAAATAPVPEFASPLPVDDLRRIDPATRAMFRRRMDSDPWYFNKHVCKQGEKVVERIHRPLLYVYTSQAALLAATLSNPRYEGKITQALRADFTRLGINWHDPSHLPRITARLKRINMRGPRGLGKSTIADAGDLWEAVTDPDITIGLGSKSDSYAEARIIAMGKIVNSPEFAFWYPERVPLNPKIDVTQSTIRLAGRTINVPEATIEGRGINSQWRGRHYRKIRLDDIAGTEYGEASMADALRFLAGLDALHVRETFGWTRDEIIGTVSGENDDHSVLLRDQDVLSIVVPIEEHQGGTTYENVFSDGTLTVPEPGWFDRGAVNTMKRKARANEDKHSVSELLQNYYMTYLADSGSPMFTRSMLDKAKGLWRFSEELQRDLMWIPRKGKESTPRDPAHPKFSIDDWKPVDPTTLPRTARAWAADQSVSQTGDEWSLAYVLMDSDGVEILYDCIKGLGYDKMLDAVRPFDKRCDSPKHVGVDTNATQGMTVEWMSRDPEYQAIARRIISITSGQEAKDTHIRRWIAGRMLTGDFYVNPKLLDWIHEASRYQPRKPDGTLKRNSIDNQLDATWMACSLCKRPPSTEQLERDAAAARISAAASSRNIDPVTGMERGTWTDCTWRAA